jgi:hypothetical protein
LVRALDEMTDYNLYDVLGELGYGLNPQTCPERAEAFGYKHSDWLKSLPPAAAETLRRLAAQFGHGGTDALENPHAFEMSDVRAAGGFAERTGTPWRVPTTIRREGSGKPVPGSLAILLRLFKQAVTVQARRDTDA